MNRTIVLLSHNRPIQDRTRECIAALTRAGAAYLLQSGCADVALARSFALTSACRTLRELNTITNPRDTVLMVDDDMVFTLDQALELVQHSRETGVAASAMYATTMGTLAATRIAGTDRWMTGLGLLAIPAGRLLELERDSKSFALHDKHYKEFTWSCVEDGQWISEDYRLCKRLGGVYLLPMAVGHMKTFPIYPDAETVAAIRTGTPLTGEPDTQQLQGLTERDIKAEVRRAGA